MYIFALTLSALSLVLVTLFFVSHRSFSVYHPLTLYIAFHALVFVIRPIVGYYVGYTYIYRAYQFTPTDSDRLTVIFASNLGFICIAIGTMLYGNVPMKFKSDDATRLERANLKAIFPWILLVCLPAGLYSLTTSFEGASLGTGGDGISLDAATGTFIHTQGSGYLLEAQLMLATCSALLAWLYRFKLWSLMPLVLFVIFRAGTGGRWPFVVALTAAGLLYLFDRRLRFAGVRLVAAIAAISIIFSIIGQDRGQEIRKWIGTDQTLAKDDGRDLHLMEGMDLGNMEYFEYLVSTVPQKTHTYGYFLDNLQLFTEPIPRALWKGKPIGPPFNNIFLFDYGHPIGMTRSLPGEGWYSLGWLGVIIWCSLWGAALGWIYRKFVESSQSNLAISGYIVFLTSLIAVFRDGLVVTLFRYGLFFLMPILVWAIFAKMKGLPSISIIRQSAAFRRIMRPRLQDDSPKIGPALDPAFSALPLAVQRRRLALARNAGSAG